MTDAAPKPTPGDQGFIPSTPAPSGAPAPSPSAHVAPGPVEKPLPAQTVDKAETIPATPAGYSDQLARIEDKAARIEDKYARSEALLSRVEEKVEGATTRMNESARQADLAALRSEVRGINERVRKVPGAGALILTALITSVLTVVLLLAAQGLHLDRYLPQRAQTTTQP